MDYIFIANIGIFTARMILRFIIVWVCINTFTDSLLRSKRRIYIETGIYILIYSSLQNITYEIVYSIDGIFNLEYFSVFYTTISLLFYILYYVPVFFYFRKAIHIDFHKLLLVFCMTFGFAYIPNSIQAFMGVFYSNLPIGYETMVITRNIVYVILCFIALFAIGLFFKGFVSKYLQVAKSEDVKKIIIIPILFFVVGWINEEFYFADLVLESIRGFYLFLALLLTALSVFVYLIIFRMQDNARKNARAEFQLKLSREHHNMLNERYTLIQKYISETRRAEHDLRHHLSAIQAYSTARENERLCLYLTDYNKTSSFLHRVQSFDQAFQPKGYIKTLPENNHIE